MRDQVKSVLCALLLFAMAPGGAAGSCIGVFASLGTEGCYMQVPGAAPVTWYLTAVLFGDAAADGITGAEFRQDGTPSGWFVTANPNPAASISLGNPIGGGANIAFQSCQSGFTVLLYTVTGFASTSVNDARLEIFQHSNPSNPDFRCPLLVICDGPTFTKVCVITGCMTINGIGKCCPLAVEPTSWSRLKSLYDR